MQIHCEGLAVNHKTSETPEGDIYLPTEQSVKCFAVIGPYIVRVIIPNTGWIATFDTKELNQAISIFYATHSPNLPSSSRSHLISSADGLERPKSWLQRALGYFRVSRRSASGKQEQEVRHSEHWNRSDGHDDGLPRSD